MAAKNNYKTCLGCCNRSRREDCLLCPDCLKAFELLLDKSADALLDDRMSEIVPVHDKFQYVIDLAEGNIANPNGPEGMGTLQFLEERAENAKTDLESKEDDLWEKACDEIMQKADVQNVGQEIVDRATESLFKRKKEESEDYKTISRRAFGYRRALEAGRGFLAEIRTKRVEYLQKKKAEAAEAAEEKSENAQAQKRQEVHETTEVKEVTA